MNNIEEMIEKGKIMLQSLSNNKSVDLDEFNSVIMALKQCIKLNPKLGKEFGPFIQKLISAKKLTDTKFDLVQIPILNGRISIGHRPKIKEIRLLKREGITHILTLLSVKEGAEKVGESVRIWGLEWIWHAMESATPPNQDQFNEYINLFKQLQTILASGGSIYIRCSAGIHRTGMIIFALLLYLGFSELEAKNLMLKLRAITHQEAGVDRFEWGIELLKYTIHKYSS